MSKTAWLPPAALFWRAFGQILIISFVPLQLALSGDHQYLALGVIYGFPFLMQLLFAPLWGRLVDRMRRPGAMAAIGFLGYAAMEAGTAVSGSVPGILFSLAIGGVFGAALSPAAKWLALRADDDHRTLALALRAEAGGWLLGALLPAAVAALGLNVFQLLGVAAILTALSGPVLYRAGAEEIALGAPPPPRADRGGLASLPAAFWLLYVGAFLQFLIGETFMAFYGIYLTRHLGGPLWLYSATIALTTALGLILYGFATHATQRSGAHRVLLATALVYLVSYGLLALFPSVAMAAVIFSVPAFGFFRIAATIGIADAAPQRRGLAMGMLDSAEGCASAVGGPVAGAFVSAFSLAVLPRLPFALSLAALVPLLLAARTARSGRPERAVSR